jgi:hypothetical protein
VTDTHWLFSYGTLQDADVQQATFGRVLGGNSDSLPGFRTELVEIIDPKVIATGGRTHHPIVVFTDDDGGAALGSHTAPKHSTTPLPDWAGCPRFP